MRLKRDFKPDFEGLFLLSDHSQNQTSRQMFSMYNIDQTQLHMMGLDSHHGVSESNHNVIGCQLLCESLVGTFNEKTILYQ